MKYEEIERYESGRPISNPYNYSEIIEALWEELERVKAAHRTAVSKLAETSEVIATLKEQSRLAKEVGRYVPMLTGVGK